MLYLISELEISLMPSENKYKLERILRYYFPCSFFVIFLLDLSRNLFSTNLRLSGTSDLLFFLGELGLPYLMLYLFTVEYEIDDDKLIVKSFLFHRKVFNLKEITQVNEEESYSLFHKIPIGINAIVLYFKNGKNLAIFGLNDHISFLQKLQSAKAE